MTAHVDPFHVQTANALQEYRRPGGSTPELFNREHRGGEAGRPALRLNLKLNTTPIERRRRITDAKQRDHLLTFLINA